jgi:F0F1-type ATP synthase membrane subunit c/vacuolar-type H+-ATPase subunit K
MSIIIGVGVTCLITGVSIGYCVAALMVAGKIADIQAGKWSQ